MHKLSHEIINEAFISPIRFALLLDDQFPTYGQTLNPMHDPGLEYERASGLFELCRSNGWLCDVDNQVRVAADFHDNKHLNQSDLLILDFHLDPLDDSNPSKAIEIVQKLSKSDHFNLVAIYTSENPITVIRDIAFCLGAGRDFSIFNTDIKDVISEIDDEIFGDIERSLNTRIIEAFLSNGAYKHEISNQRKLLKTAEIPAQFHVDVVNHICAQYFQSHIDEIVWSNRQCNNQVVGDFADDDKVKWLKFENVFVAVMNKQRTEPHLLLDGLKMALYAWNPTPLQVMMVHARSVLEKAGNMSDHQVLSDPTRQAGWLLHILLTTSESERLQSIHDLYRRLFERLIDATGPALIGLGNRLLDPGKLTPVHAAKRLARATGINDIEVFHALNEHLCSEPHPNGPITTGVIFREKNRNEFWLCTTPACDLMPGRENGGKLAPWLPVTAAKLTLVVKEKAIAELMKAAEVGNHIFIRENGKPLVFEVIHPKSRHMTIESILLENDGIVSNQSFRGHRICLGQAESPVLEAFEYAVLGRLRTAYASRLLAASGYQRSRIGVDFINMPHIAPNNLTFIPKFGFSKDIDYIYKSLNMDSTNGFINASASITGTALPICTPAAISPPEK